MAERLPLVAEIIFLAVCNFYMFGAINAHTCHHRVETLTGASGWPQSDPRVLGSGLGRRSNSC